MRRRAAALAAAPLLFLAAACGGGGDDEADAVPGLTVTGEVGEVPTVEIDEPLDVGEPTSEVLTEGDGKPVVEGTPASLHLYVANGSTGDKVVATHDQGQPFNAPVTEGQLPAAVVDALVGQPAGSRIAFAAPANDALGESVAEQNGLAGDDVVFVVDIMSVPLDGPEGEKAEVPGDLPTLQTDEGAVTGFDFSGAPKQPPGKLQVVPLIEGEGDPIEAGDQVTIDYLGQVYGTDKVFDQSYNDAPRAFAVGAGGLIKAWDEGLVGVKEGSRVLIVAPPDTAYGKTGQPPDIKGDATLVFVVDVLDVG